MAKVRQVGRVRQALFETGRAAVPSGRIWRLRARMTVDLVMTLAMMAFAAVASITYQVVRWRSGRSGRP